MDHSSWADSSPSVGKSWLSKGSKLFFDSHPVTQERLITMKKMYSTGKRGYRNRTVFLQRLCFFQYPNPEKPSAPWAIFCPVLGLCYHFVLCVCVNLLQLTLGTHMTILLKWNRSHLPWHQSCLPEKVPCSCEQDEQVCAGLSCYCCSPAWHLSLPACTAQIVKSIKGEATDHGHLTHMPWGKVALQLNPYQNQKINSQRPKICRHAGNAEPYVCFLS